MSRSQSKAQTLSFLSIERFGGKAGRGLAIELRERNPYLPRSSPYAARIVKTPRKRWIIQGTNKCLW
jgi:hypothetical protein